MIFNFFKTKFKKLDPNIKILTLTEAVDYTGISRSIIRQALMEERLAGRQIEGAWVIYRGDIEKFARKYKGE